MILTDVDAAIAERFIEQASDIELQVLWASIDYIGEQKTMDIIRHWIKTKEEVKR